MSYLWGYEDVPLLEFMDHVQTRMPDDSYRRRLRSLLYLCCVFLELFNPLCFDLHKNSGPRSVSDQLYNYIMAQTSGTAGHSGSVCDDEVGNKCRTSWEIQVGAGPPTVYFIDSVQLMLSVAAVAITDLLLTIVYHDGGVFGSPTFFFISSV